MSGHYAGLAVEAWAARTDELVRAHPFDMTELVNVVLEAWDGIFSSSFGSRKYLIGKDIFPKPQVMGFLLEELVTLELARRHPESWRRDQEGHEKDLVYMPDDQYSTEMKTSSSNENIYGNRSYAQKRTKRGAKKSKEGYYLAVNYEKFEQLGPRPEIRLIRFGWLDHSDWTGQTAATGQRASLSKEVEMYKLKTLYKK